MTTQKIKFITDSACDIPEVYAEKYNIEVLPFPITVDDKSYLERIDFSNQEFYKILLESQNIPVTSHITVPRFTESFQNAINENYTHIIVVTINSKGSNTYQAALMAKETLFEEHPEYKNKVGITILDSLTYSLGYGYPLIQAASMAQENVNVYDIISYLDDAFSRIEIFFTVHTLEFAKKSGRIKTAAAFVGDVLGLRPILHIIDGQINTIDKVRGDKNAFPKIIQYAKNKRSKKYDDYVILGGMDKDITQEFSKICKKDLGKKHSGDFTIGAAIAINAGPKITGIVVFGEKRK